MNDPIPVLRRAAIVGACAALGYQAVVSFPLRPRLEAAFVLLVVAVGAAALALRLVLPSAASRIRARPDQLVPLALLVAAHAALDLSARFPPAAAILTPDSRVQLLGLTFSLSVSFALRIGLQVGYGAWITTLILDEDHDLRRSAGGIRRRFLRVLGIEAAGWAVLFAGVAVGIALGRASLPLAMVVIGAGSFLWNLATAACLPVALDERLGFGEALRAGVRTSWERKATWWKPIAAHRAPGRDHVRQRLLLRPRLPAEPDELGRERVLGRRLRARLPLELGPHGRPGHPDRPARLDRAGPRVRSPGHRGEDRDRRTATGPGRTAPRHRLAVAARAPRSRARAASSRPPTRSRPGARARRRPPGRRASRGRRS